MQELDRRPLPGRVLPEVDDPLAALANAPDDAERPQLARLPAPSGSICGIFVPTVSSNSDQPNFTARRRLDPTRYRDVTLLASRRASHRSPALADSPDTELSITTIATIWRYSLLARYR
nr:hypothetical protein GCM10020093_090390 [Planobispora longispora]